MESTEAVANTEKAHGVQSNGVGNPSKGTPTPPLVAAEEAPKIDACDESENEAGASVDCVAAATADIGSAPGDPTAPVPVSDSDTMCNTLREVSEYIVLVYDEVLATLVSTLETLTDGANNVAVCFGWGFMHDTAENAGEAHDPPGPTSVFV